MSKKYTTKWNLKKLYKSDLLWEKDFILLNNMVKKFGTLKGSIKTSNDLLKVLNLEAKIDIKDMKLFSYAFLQVELNRNNPKYKTMFAKIMNNSSFIRMETSWLDREIIALPKSKLKYFLNLKKLKKHEDRLSLISNSKSKGMISRKEERVFELARGVFDSFNEIKNDIELTNVKFPKIKSTNGKSLILNHSNMVSYERHPDRNIRKQVALSRNKAYQKNLNSFAGLLRGHVQSKVIEARTFNHNSPVSLILEEEDINQEFLENFLKESFKYNKYFHEYFELKRKKLKLRKFKKYDILSPISPLKKIPYSEAIRWYMNSIESLGKDYINISKKAFKENWVDSTDSANKSTPNCLGFSFNPYVTHPHVFLTYKGDVDSMMTLSHEMGHALHNFQMNKNNSFYSLDNSFTLSEAFAFTNEMLTLYEVINNSRSPNLKLHALWNLRDMFFINIIQKSIESEFELFIYNLVNENKKWNASILCKEYKKIEAKYLGKSLDLTGSKGLSWAMGDAAFSNFYSGKYLIAFCLAVNFVERILANDDEFIYKYNKALKKGNQENLPSILKNLDIDLKDSASLIKNTFKKFQELLVD